jgi:hypothetical protein
MAGNINYADRQKRFMETFKDDPILTTTLPEVAAKLFRTEFGVSIDDLTYIPIVWSVTWSRLLNFIHSQKTDSFSVHLCGFTIEYMTEYSESDKSTNIVPEMYHEFIPIFTNRHHDVVAGSDYNRDLINKYNAWRSENSTETIDMVEREVFNEVNEKYGIWLMVSASVMPLMAAIYAAGVSIAREKHVPVNMYNWFTITARDNDKIILTPLAPIKQGLKDDAKK